VYFSGAPSGAFGVSSFSIDGAVVSVGDGVGGELVVGGVVGVSGAVTGLGFVELLVSTGVGEFSGMTFPYHRYVVIGADPVDIGEKFKSSVPFSLAKGHSKRVGRETRFEAVTPLQQIINPRPAVPSRHEFSENVVSGLSVGFDLSLKFFSMFWVSNIWHLNRPPC
jgi:hypothetical protein